MLLNLHEWWGPTVLLVLKDLRLYGTMIILTYHDLWQWWDSQLCYIDCAVLIHQLGKGRSVCSSDRFCSSAATLNRRCYSLKWVEKCSSCSYYCFAATLNICFYSQDCQAIRQDSDGSICSQFTGGWAVWAHPCLWVKCWLAGCCSTFTSSWVLLLCFLIWCSKSASVFHIY